LLFQSVVKLGALRIFFHVNRSKFRGPKIRFGVKNIYELCTNLQRLNTKRIVITGGPGSGKTTLIDHLTDLGYDCMPEISREVTLEAQKQGIEQLFLEDPILFSRKLLFGRLDQFHEGAHFDKDLLFYDRGMPDVTAYLEYLETEYPREFAEICAEHTYDIVFMLPPWEAIYASDNERYESWEIAVTIAEFLEQEYRKFGYEVYIVPEGTLSERATFILDKLNDII